jgi:hypothetical protein
MPSKWRNQTASLAVVPVSDPPQGRRFVEHNAPGAAAVERKLRLARRQSHFAGLEPSLHRQPEPPPSLAEFERHVMAADVVLIDRALIRALLRYVRGLEREVPTP